MDLESRVKDLERALEQLKKEKKEKEEKECPLCYGKGYITRNRYYKTLRNTRKPILGKVSVA